ncbi:hypothetical protein ACFL40_03040 [candidate division KSB1 bacterium]
MLYHISGKPEEFKELLDCFECLEKIKEQGKLRSYGISISLVEYAIQIIRHGKGDVLQVLLMADKHSIGIIV